MQGICEAILDGRCDGLNTNYKECTHSYLHNIDIYCKCSYCNKIKNSFLNCIMDKGYHFENELPKDLFEL
jgi:hypothetical protein